jgi:hypothetical protein
MNTTNATATQKAASTGRVTVAPRPMTTAIRTAAARTATHRAAALLVRAQYAEQSKSAATSSPSSSLSARINHHTPDTAPHATKIQRSSTDWPEQSDGSPGHWRAKAALQQSPPSASQYPPGEMYEHSLHRSDVPLQYCPTAQSDCCAHNWAQSYGSLGHWRSKAALQQPESPSASQ